jgi:hypothetical protein
MNFNNAFVFVLSLLGPKQPAFSVQSSGTSTSPQHMRNLNAVMAAVILCRTDVKSFEDVGQLSYSTKYLQTGNTFYS